MNLRNYSMRANNFLIFKCYYNYETNIEREYERHVASYEMMLIPPYFIYFYRQILERHFRFCLYTSSLKKTSDLKILLSNTHSSHIEIFFDPVGF